jgi:hypothetical protein
MAKKRAMDEVEINDFLEEMISILETRLERQEESISAIETEIKGLRAAMDGISRKGGPMKIDKSVLKVLRQ